MLSILADGWDLLIAHPSGVGLAMALRPVSGRVGARRGGDRQGGFFLFRQLVTKLAQELHCAAQRWAHGSDLENLVTKLAQELQCAPSLVAAHGSSARLD